MSTIYTIEGNTSGGAILVANGGSVAKKSYDSNDDRIYIYKIWRPKYISGEAEKVAKQASHWIGYIEKKSNNHLEDFKANAGNKNFTIFAKDAGEKTGEKGIYANGYPWCETFVSDVLILALGPKRAKTLVYSWTASCTTANNYYHKAGATEIKDFTKSKYGDIILFKNSSNEICHTGFVITGYNKDTAPAATSYKQTDFIKDIKSIFKANTVYAAFNKTVTIKKNQNNVHPAVTPIQKYLTSLGHYKGVVDGHYGPLTEAAVKEYQKAVVGLNTPDGIITAKHPTWRKLLGLS